MQNITKSCKPTKGMHNKHKGMQYNYKETQNNHKKLQKWPLRETKWLHRCKTTTEMQNNYKVTTKKPKWTKRDAKRPQEVQNKIQTRTENKTQNYYK